MIAVIDVSGNNLTSLTNALRRLGFDYVLTHDAKEIQKASHVILPGVGAAAYGMNSLREHGLDKVLTTLTQPILGICLGMQLLLEYSEEGDVDCLGLIPGTAELLTREKYYPVPHMGWNQLKWRQNSPLQQGLDSKEHVYFVHSYALKETQHALASCDYNQEFSAIINKNNIFGMQFHPEKSAETGMILLNNFLSLESIC
ncbi:imidazole glycerol phosphate synthase subunit HisH [Legionella maioricensis]|uniref:Imidazole glycerol phosphate synthase subunit HisH n=1 Tax=Legionella maioricensis TaxID=2896528 RepID=A0A9X2D2S2_9GAMM|nr:imidazole glycerol phosphate synthase subunit HisH [Legionella maioricensis]MCL9685408.1 imidazole glycerol phosphate synthase subunit HisH [Legionella maioricensis]MCL9688633.1 imidazole glycerol phosphate synthase subunit HisH [Legionella maioricensis]